MQEEVQEVCESTGEHLSCLVKIKCKLLLLLCRQLQTEKFFKSVVL